MSGYIKCSTSFQWNIILATRKQIMHTWQCGWTLKTVKSKNLITQKTNIDFCLYKKSGIVKSKGTQGRLMVSLGLEDRWQRWIGNDY